MSDVTTAVIDSLTQSQEWRNVRLLLERLDSDESRATIDTMDLLVEHFERLCEKKPTWK